MAVRIFLAEDHHLIRQGVRLLLDAEADFFVVGEAGDGIDAVESVFRLQPDILIVDVVLPALNGIEVTRAVKAQLPTIKVIALSMYDTVAYVSASLTAGASAYVLKKSTAAELVTAIHRVMDGHVYLSPPLDEHALAEYVLSSEEVHDDAYTLLTPRERQVLQMAAEGLNNPAIAERLALSVRTVEMHRANMMRKLDLRNQTDIVRYVIKQGIVD